MGRILHLRDQGQVKFYEQSTNGESRVIVQAPDALVADLTITLPSALPAGTQLLSLTALGVVTPVADGTSGYFLRTDGAGSFTWATGATSLDEAYNNGHAVTIDAGAIGLTAGPGAVTSLLTLAQGNTASTAALLSIANSGTGNCISLAQAAAAQGIYVMEAANSHAADFQKSDAGNAACVNIVNSGVGPGLKIAQKAEGTALEINKSTGGASNALTVVNSGTGVGITVDQVGNGNAASFTKTSTDASSAVIVSVQSGSGVGLYVNNGRAGSGVRIDQDASTTTGALAININATGTGVLITQSASGSGIKVAIPVDGADGIYIYKNDTTAPGLASGTCLKITNSSGVNPVNIIQVHTGSAHVVSISNSGSGYDVRGHSGNWFCTPAGYGYFGSINHPKAAQCQNATVNMITTSTAYENRGTISVTVPSTGSTSVRLASWSQITPSTSGSSANFYTRIKRDGNLIASGIIYSDNGWGGARAGIEWIDINPGAGAHSYTYEIRAISSDVRHEHSEIIGVLVNCSGTSC